MMKTNFNEKNSKRNESFASTFKESSGLIKLKIAGLQKKQRLNALANGSAGSFDQGSSTKKPKYLIEQDAKKTENLLRMERIKQSR